MATADFKGDVNDDTWLTELYKIDLIDDNELKEWVDLYSYKGFNRVKVLLQLKKKFPNPKEAAEVIVICAMKGPMRAAITQMKNGKTLEAQGVPGSRVQGTDLISCQRITAATADLAAFFLKRMDSPKRLNLACPGWLQFPSAGSIDLPKELRLAHYEFAKSFSPVIGGVFNEQIYQQMVNNCYLNPNLHLFDVVQQSYVAAPPTSISSSSSMPQQLPKAVVVKTNR